MARLTKEERVVVRRLSEAYGAFRKLSAYHVVDDDEFGRLIRTAQNMVMSRPTAREQK